MSQPAEPIAVPTRREVPVALTWDLTPLYAAPEAWEADFARLDDLLAPVLALQGQLNSAAAVARLLEAETALDRVLEKLHTYAHLRHDEDTVDDANQSREARIRARYAELAAQCAWITPNCWRIPKPKSARGWRRRR